MENKVLKIVDSYDLISQDERVLVALSGGADSVVLLHVLKRLGYNICAAHINHMIRGEEALRDEVFAVDLCKELEIPLRVYQKNCPEYAKSANLSLESAARILRYEALEEASAIFGCQKIATAHTENDNLETMLMRLIRGSSSYGLRGIDIKRGSIIRPLLHCPRDEIIGYAKKHNLSYVTDSINKDMSYLRNRIRHMLLPELKSSYNPNIAAALSRLSENLKTDSDYFAGETQRAYKEYVVLHVNSGSVTISNRAAKDLHSAVLERLIRFSVKSLLGNEKDFDNIHTKMVTELFNMRSGKKINLTKGLIAANTFGDVDIYKEKPALTKEFPLNPGDFIQIENSDYFISVSSEKINFRENFVNTCTEVFICDRIMGSLVVRGRKNGDIINTSKGKTLKYKDFLINKRIPVFIRDDTYVLAYGNKVLIMFLPLPYIAKETALTESVSKGNEVYVGLWRKRESDG